MDSAKERERVIGKSSIENVAVGTWGLDEAMKGKKRN